MPYGAVQAALQQLIEVRLGFPERRPHNVGMDIQLNGETRNLPGPMSLQALLNDEGLAERRVAVEVNGEIVPRSLHGTQLLQEGDVIEIVHALGGG